MDEIRVVLENYRITIPTGGCELLGNAGGFSGSVLWRVSSGGRQFCLRRWPPETQISRLELIHAVLLHVVNGGFELLPVPIRTASGATFIRQKGTIWELTPWMPGTANYHESPNRQKLSSAMTSLARFHKQASTFEPARKSVSPAISQRRKMVDDLNSGEFSRLTKVVSNTDSTNPLTSKCLELLHLISVVLPSLQTELTRASNLETSVQPCIRDVWHDHILFTGNEVSGIVDFGALQTDTVATDIARLLGSLVRDDELLWQWGLVYYCDSRGLDEAEHQLVGVFDRSFVALAGINWIRWLFVERRQFEDESRVHARIDEILNRLRFLAAKTPNQL